MLDIVPRSSAYKQLRGHYSRISAGRGWRPTQLRLAKPRARLNIILPDARSVPAGVLGACWGTEELGWNERSHYET